ncbi:MAG: DUF3592 domain-containing protein [Anaerolineales bacterium]
MKTENQVNPPRQRLGCAFLLLPISAVILIGVSVWYLYSSYTFSTTGVKVQGTVIRLESSTSENGITYSPVFQYTYNGQQYEYESINSSDPPSNQVGDVETLLVNPNDPSKARQNGFGELWLVPLILCMVSVLLIILSVGIPFLVRRS